MSSRPTAGATQSSTAAVASQDPPDPVDSREVSDAVLSRTCDDLIDEVVLGLCFEIHRAVKMGTFFLNDVDEASEKEYGTHERESTSSSIASKHIGKLVSHEIVDEIGLDVFGQVPMKKQLECVCPNCQRNLAASRFAPHLEKCMGMGRSSSRIANRRIANTSCGVLKDSGGGGGAHGGGGGGSTGLGGGTSSSAGLTALSDQDDENDDDWTYNSDRKGPKKKREKNSNHSPRRPKTSKMKNGESTTASSVACSSEAASYPNYESMSVDDRKVLLVQMCGVISEHTRRMCTRSHRCPQHTDDQRKAVRVTLLGSQIGSSLEMNDDVQVETLDDLDGQLLRAGDTLWESSTSANPSPTDSTSTNNSTASSKKREKRSKNGTTKRNKKPKSQNPKGGTTGGNSNAVASVVASTTSASTLPPPPPPPTTTHEQCS